MTNPAAVAPQATPTPIPVFSQDIASVVRPGQACDSIRLYPAISVGAIAIPHRNWTRASTVRSGTAPNVHTPATVRVSVTANRRQPGARQFRVPYHSPPAPLPHAQQASRNPASALWPKCAANATVDRSTVTNMAPRNTYTGTSTARPGAAREKWREAVSWVRSEENSRLARGRGGGSVSRCDANHSVPPRQSAAAAVTPAAG